MQTIVTEAERARDDWIESIDRRAMHDKCSEFVEKYKGIT
jgi:hypothetical protein